MGKKLKISYVKNYFEDLGYTLLDSVYINSRTPINYICPEGHKGKSKWSDFFQGKRCKLCGHKKSADSKRTSFSEIKKMFEVEGWSVLSEEYKNTDTALDCLCPRGHRTNINSHNFKSGWRCALCSGKKPSKDNNLSVYFPKLIDEWDCDKNFPLRPEEVTVGSNKGVWWVCSCCKNSWKAPIKNRTLNKSGCSKCNSGGISSVSQEWLDKIGIPQEFREFRLKTSDKKYYIVDGFDQKTNTVYEFLGDFWHGNPKIYNQADTNPVNKKTFGQLYKETFERFRSMEKSGYKVIYIWEKDFKVC